MRVLWATLAALWLGFSGGRAVSAESARADQIKVGYVVNFVKLVEWPPTLPSELLRVCFLGADTMLQAFTADLADKRVGAHRMSVRALKKGEDAHDCDVLYMDATVESALPPSSAGVLTIGEQADFIHHGGIIGLFMLDNRLRFNINLENARRARLKISSALLQLASSVEREAS